MSASDSRGSGRSGPVAGPGVGRHLLVVDDDDRIRELLKEFLAREGYRVTGAAHAAAAKRLIELIEFDLIVLDVMMPGETGFDLTTWVREKAMASKTPILLLTAKGDAEDRIEGLSRGADDYMSKPFDPRELALRIDAILRRTGGKPLTPREIKLGDVVFDMERLELTRDGKPQRLTEAEAQLLRTLAIHAHAPVERMSLSPDTADITGRAVDVQVTRLRRKLESDPKNPRYLQTVRGVGYMLAPD
ncbi:response regulator transcription factor [Brevundimonas sp. S30B]|uniref:response regulator n=1 Tax=unclassified Brevundimonas TaxID=2622653 RepID=UPI001072B6E9|nr:MULTISPECIES: response regulator transcription factor [unclassified Brevundimonas]QBX36988.1 response regulator transcription factor [Brevundimonas sp. MF30-B]TFW04216.1 response regulator transcription factor [Brevundimonas sp. S30B]